MKLGRKCYRCARTNNDCDREVEAHSPSSELSATNLRCAGCIATNSPCFTAPVRSNKSINAARPQHHPSMTGLKLARFAVPPPVPSKTFNHYSAIASHFACLPKLLRQSAETAFVSRTDSEGGAPAYTPAGRGRKLIPVTTTTIVNASKLVPYLSAGSYELVLYEPDAVFTRVAAGRAVSLFEYTLKAIPGLVHGGGFSELRLSKPCGYFARTTKEKIRHRILGRIKAKQDQEQRFIGLTGLRQLNNKTIAHLQGIYTFPVLAHHASATGKRMARQERLDGVNETDEEGTEEQNTLA
ncbi:hypothetical protein HDU78_002049 [Chytriomyces hyalinus]|nr:hypothetical protein HDU78_002049 [Chytriomyces hyalinus]